MAARFGSNIVLRYDVSGDREIGDMFAQLEYYYWKVSTGIVRSIGFRTAQALGGISSANRSRRGVCRGARYRSAWLRFSQGRRDQLRDNATLLTLSYLGAERNAELQRYGAIGIQSRNLCAMQADPSVSDRCSISASPIEQPPRRRHHQLQQGLHHVAANAPCQLLISIEKSAMLLRS